MLICGKTTDADKNMKFISESEIDTNLCIRICEKVVLTLIGLDEKVTYVLI